MIGKIKTHLATGLAVLAGLFYGLWQMSRRGREQDEHELAAAVTEQKTKTDKALIDGLEREQKVKADAEKADIDDIIHHFS